MSRIQKDYLKHITGYRGEEMVDYKLRTQTNSDFLIFHDLRFRVNHHFFQIDTLILTSSFLLILEIKNIKGILEYDSDLQQLIRIYGDKQEGFKNPILQAEMQEINLHAWLQNHLKLIIRQLNP